MRSILKYISLSTIFYLQWLHWFEAFQCLQFVHLHLPLVDHLVGSLWQLGEINAMMCIQNLYYILTYLYVYL